MEISTVSDIPNYAVRASAVATLHLPYSWHCLLNGIIGDASSESLPHTVVSLLAGLDIETLVPASRATTSEPGHYLVLSAARRGQLGILSFSPLIGSLFFYN